VVVWEGELRPVGGERLQPGLPFLTVTLSLLLLPLPSLARVLALRVTVPLLVLVLSQGLLQLAVVPLTVQLPRLVLPAFREIELILPEEIAALALTVTDPETVAPEGGAVREMVGVGEGLLGLQVVSSPSMVSNRALTHSCFTGSGFPLLS
jgi:hypothetical protein